MENNIVYDLMLLESDRVIAYKRKEVDLYYKDQYGNFEKIAEGYDKGVEDLLASILKKRKMRYMITFIDAIDMQDDLKPSAFKILRFFIKNMSYGNIVKGYGFIDMNRELRMNTHFITSALNQLFEKDIVRYEKVKGRRVYMINPIMFYKGSMKNIFSLVKKFNDIPNYKDHLEGKKKIIVEVKEEKKTIF